MWITEKSLKRNFKKQLYRIKNFKKIVDTEKAVLRGKLSAYIQKEERSIISNLSSTSGN